ncbi:MAG: ABC transporter permease [Rikenellaceae bacterium]|nr:ABC transporter permease [Rikenellaceae bacterium]
MNKIVLIIQREFSERARKKSFIITTLIMPLIMIGLMIAPSLVAVYSTGDTKQVVIVDESGKVAPQLIHASTPELKYVDQSQLTIDEARDTYNEDSGIFAILHIDEQGATDGNISLYTNSSSTPIIEQTIATHVKAIIEHNKAQEVIPGVDLNKVLADIATEVNIETMNNDGTDYASGISYALSLILGMLLYMIIILYGQMVLTSVVEEKSSRVIDVMVTSCSPFQLMVGKILGIASVALTQIAIWAVLVISASKFVIPELFSAEVAASSDAMLQSLMGTLTDTGYIATLLAYLILYILGGFLLYASLYAAAGSAVDSVQDGQQFNTIIMMPIILALIVMMSVFNDPNSSVVFWFSMIPFTSPIVMIARIPFGIATWEIIVSLVALYATFIVTTWIAAKVYRIGIFTHGKRASWRELWQWLRTK